MAFLKILFWVVAVVLVLLILIVGTVLFLLSVKIQVGGEYAPDVKRFWIKYGFFKLKIYPEMFSEKKKAKRAKLMGKLKSWFGPKAKKVSNKAKEKAAEKVEETKVKKSAEKDFNTAVEIREEEIRIAETEKKLEVEIPKVEAEYEAAVAAEEAGKPWDNVVNQKEVSKIENIKTSLQAADLPGAYDKAVDFLSGFSFDSIVALLATIGKETTGTLGKVARKINIKQFNVGLVISGSDAAATALKYGRIGAIAYPALGKLANSLTVGDISLDMTPDYLANKDSGEIHAIIAVRPLTLVTPFIGYLPKVGKAGFGFYREYKATKKEKAKAKAEA
ncbi:MAG: hypothetical protein KBS43_04900 [Oscillospiraceae bacterium]|nr:hypothetical protein [Candidatus Limimonas coprohippi]